MPSPMLKDSISLIHGCFLTGGLHDKLVARVFPDDAFQAPKLGLATFFLDLLKRSRDDPQLLKALVDP